MFDDAKNAIKESSRSSSIYVGADSIIFTKDGERYAKYSTVIIIHIDSKHGCKIFHNSVDMKDYGNLKQRLMMEVQMAVEAATEILEVLDDRSLSIHLDLNPNPRYKSNIAVREALGWVRGSLGIDAELKPRAWAASTCADHIVRK